ncbi:5-hydroxytryptamine receptor 1A-alpha-like isoform X2 [Gordionus sp. m RMFG-2023]|uniref:5-hydroxytryptamine receptor 1A-alpha-like isoform X2 n=1 Tax=Gordionus sp. m RMFG-2023 TaxID=3053472 RepID=UPI0031FD36CD
MNFNDSSLVKEIVLMNITMVFGNASVIMAVIFNRRLRTTRYYMISSLAVADICLGIFVIPFAGINLILKRWPLGLKFCRIYLTSDILFSTVSVLHLCAIAWDQFIAVRFPFQYKSVLNNIIIWSVIAFIWVVSGLIAIIPVNFKMDWYQEPTRLENYLNPEYCFVQIRKEFTMIVLPLTFYLPMISMVAIYLYIILTIRRRFRKICQVATRVEGIKNNLFSTSPYSTVSRHNKDSTIRFKSIANVGTSYIDSKDQDNRCKKDKNQKRQEETEMENIGSRGEIMAGNENENMMKYRKVLLMVGLNFLLRKLNLFKRSSIFVKMDSMGKFEREECKSGENSSQNNEKLADPCKIQNKAEKIGTHPSLKSSVYSRVGEVMNESRNFQLNPATTNYLNSPRPKTLVKRSITILSVSQQNNAQNLNSFLAEARLKKQVRALKTVGMITLAFVICWTPFCLIMVWQSVCWCLSEQALNSMLWLGYLNSCFNPYIYAVWNNDFRMAYSTIFKSVRKCCSRAK